MSGDTPPGTTLKCPHSEAVRKRWGDSVSEARWAALGALRDRQRGWAAKPEAGCGASHFKNVPLTGADAFWLAEAPGRNEMNCVPNLRLEGADLDGAQLEGAVVTDLRWAHLEGADLREAHLSSADLNRAHLRADLRFARLWGGQPP